MGLTEDLNFGSMNFSRGFANPIRGAQSFSPLSILILIRKCLIVHSESRFNSGAELRLGFRRRAEGTSDQQEDVAKDIRAVRRRQLLRNSFPLVE